MTDKEKEAMDMLYRAKWNVPKAALHMGVTSEECKEVFRQYCCERPVSEVVDWAETGRPPT